MLLGRVSTNTVASGIADIQSFENHPEAYAYGMVCALLVGSIWLIVTSYYGLNVSSTHTISKSFICPVPWTLSSPHIPELLSVRRIFQTSVGRLKIWKAPESRAEELRGRIV